MGQKEGEFQVDHDENDIPTLLETLTTEGLKNAFQLFAEAQHSEENLSFWWDVEVFRQADTPEGRLSKAKEISSVRGFE
jgi:hypothetical protein